MRHLFLTTIYAMIAAAPVSALAADGTPLRPITTVVELFTSQGCSSCPPADALVPTYSAREGVLALTFNVDIWDSLGWKDTLAKPAFTQRQRDSARARGDGQVYTPQAVINGTVHAVGSDKSAIDSGIRASAQDAAALQAQLTVTADGSGVDVSAAPRDGARGGKISEATVWLVKMVPEVNVAIHHGENSGHSVTYHNVVRELAPVGRWNGSQAAFHISPEAVAGCRPGTCAILIQKDKAGAILGAAWVPGSSGI